MKLGTGLLCGSLLCGCATMPPTGAPATGERLWVESQIVTTQHTEKQKVGEVQHKSSTGQSVGSSEVYADRQVTQHHLVWRPMQGQSGVDEYDFFHIAGDAAAAEDIREARKSGITMNRAGLGVAAGSLVAMFAGYALMKPDGSGPGRPLVYAGGLGLAVGGTLAYFGYARNAPSTHFKEREYAETAAHQYNMRLASAPPPPAAAPAPAAAFKEPDAADKAPAAAPKAVPAGRKASRRR